MTTQHFDDNASSSSQLQQPQQPKKQPQQKQDDKEMFFDMTPSSAFDYNPFDAYSWSMTPLSPPLAKQEQATVHPPLPPPLPPVSYPSTNNGGNNSGGAWHSLWSTSTWQNNTDPTQWVNKRRSSISVASPLFDTGMDNYFRQVDSSNQSNKSSFASPLALKGFMTNPNTDIDKSSIWSIPQYPVPMKGNSAGHRHSIAVAQPYFARPLTPPPTCPAPQQQIIQPSQQQQLDEYFSPSTTTIDVQCLGKGINIDEIKDDQSLYLVQFKNNYRSDYFYIQQDDTLCVQLDDMVIVEADRGYDLGKVVKISQKTTALVSSYPNVKRVFRHANPAELITHTQKEQDEHKALTVCQAKIKQRNLNMKVVDAEYQWDRRKLTFYFKANERIDFRELVRELFKIHKTRIWMCAYSTLNE